MSEYESRFDVLKEASEWHFDKWRQEPLQFKIPGRFIGDWGAELEALMQKGDKRGFNFLNKFRDASKKPLTYNLDKNDMEKMGLPEDYVFLHKIIFPDLNENDCPLLWKMSDYFGMNNALRKIHIQSPGMVFPLHLDDLARNKGKFERDGYDKKVVGDLPNNMLARFEVQLFDWEWGHVWGMGNDYWKQWKAGEIMWHEWWNHPHGTANFGMTPRVTLQVTGRVTPKTAEIIAGSYREIPVSEL